MSNKIFSSVAKATDLISSERDPAALLYYHYYPGPPSLILIRRMMHSRCSSWRGARLTCVAWRRGNKRISREGHAMDAPRSI